MGASARAAGPFEEIEAPGTSPWGVVDHATRLGPGAWQVSTPGHGGVRLSRARNAAMPDALRLAGGWYEEDAEWALVALAFPELFGADAAKVDARVRDDFPDRYEAHTGERLTPERSRVVAARVRAHENRDRFVTRSAFGDWATFVPPGMVGVVAERASDGATQWHLVPAAEYETRGGGAFVVDEARHERVPTPGPEGTVPRRRAA